MKKYEVTDPEHVDGGKIIAAEDPDEAARMYVDNECDDVGLDEEVEFTMTDGIKTWNVTVEICRELHVSMSVLPKAKKAKKR